MTRIRLIFIALIILWSDAPRLHAAAPTGSGEDAPAERLGILPNDDEPIEPKEFSARDKKLECRKYNNKYISYAGNVYLVENCKTREIQTSDMIFELNRKQTKFIEVDAQTVATLDSGEPVTGIRPMSTKKRSCKELTSKYVTYSYSDVFYVEGCKRLPFPDWETYIEHRKKHGHTRSEIDALTYEEFQSLPPGKEVPSILQSEFAKLLVGKKGIEVIPVDEACRGVNGQYASFHSKFYKVEKCHKREIDPELFSMHQGLASRKLKVVELTAEQWLSLPDGKPIRQ